MSIVLFVFFAIILFIISGLLGKVMYHHDDSLFSYSTFHCNSEKDETLGGNFVLKTFFPSVFIVIISWLLQITNQDILTKNIWLIVVFYWVVRILYILIILNRASLTNYVYEFISLTISVVSSLIVYYVFIEYCIQNNISVFLSRDELRSGIAFSLFLYAVSIIWKIINNNGLFSRERIYHEDIIFKDLRRRTRKLYQKYGAFVRNVFSQNLDEDIFSEKEFFLVRLFFSIMIVEDINRPYLIRKFETFIHHTFRRNVPMTVGIMQVTSTKPLNDKESIIEAVKFFIRILKEKLEETNGNPAIDDYSIECAIVDSYNRNDDYFSEVDFISETIGQWLDIVTK